MCLSHLDIVVKVSALPDPKKKKRKKSQTYGKLKEDSDAVLF